MAYNLNYNPGIDHDRAVRRRKILIWTVIAILVVAIGALIYIGFRDSGSQPAENGYKSVFDNLSDEQKKELLNNMSSNGSSTLSNSQLKPLVSSMSAKESSSKATSTDDGGIIQGQQRDDLFKSMSAH